MGKRSSRRRSHGAVPNAGVSVPLPHPGPLGALFLATSLGALWAIWIYVHALTIASECDAAKIATRTTLSLGEKSSWKMALRADNPGACPREPSSLENWVAGANENLTIRYLLLIIVLGLVALTCRLWRIAVHTARPTIAISGPPNIARDENEGPEKSSTEIDRAIIDVRLALSDLRLFNMAISPGDPTPAGIVAAVRGTETDSPVKMLAIVMDWLTGRPYQVSIAIHEDSRGKGLIVEVSDPRGRDSYTKTVHGTSRENTARRAAHAIGAFVLPRTEGSLRPPYTPWHGIRLRPKVFGHFLEAQRLAWEDRYEEALHEFDQAVAMDPLNSYIRLERALVLDSLGMYIDALAGYLDVVTIQGRHDPNFRHAYQSMLDTGHRFPEPKRTKRDEIKAKIKARRRGTASSGGSPDGDPALQSARFRAAATLAASERLARQWASHRDPAQAQKQPRRHQEVDPILRELGRWLEPYARLLAKPYGIELPATAFSATEIAELEKSPEMLRRILQFAALTECKKLESDYGQLHGRRRSGMPVSQPTLRVMVCWATIQHDYVEIDQRLNSDADNIRAWLEKISTRSSSAPAKPPTENPATPESTKTRPVNTRAYAPWPPDPDHVERLLRDAFRGRRPLGQNEHYVMACTMAVSVLTPRFLKRLEEGPEGRAPLNDGSAAASDVTAASDVPCQRPVAGHQKHRAERPITVAEEYRVRLRDHEMFVQRAVEHLAGSVMASDSQNAAVTASWLRRGDQDLNDLRSTSEYLAFVDRYLPLTVAAPSGRVTVPTAGGRAEPLPANIARLTVSEHILNLAIDYAKVREAYWAGRSTSRIGPGDLGEEAEWWAQFGEYCDNTRDWRTRLELISRVREFLRSHHDEAIAGDWPHMTAAMPALGRVPGMSDLDPAQPRGLPESLATLLEQDPALYRARQEIAAAGELKRRATSCIDAREILFSELAKLLGAGSGRAHAAPATPSSHEDVPPGGRSVDNHGVGAGQRGRVQPAGAGVITGAPPRAADLRAADPDRAANLRASSRQQAAEARATDRDTAAACQAAWKQLVDLLERGRDVLLTDCKLPPSMRADIRKFRRPV